jgi:flagellin-like hook-associated protein FlgL
MVTKVTGATAESTVQSADPTKKDRTFTKIKGQLAQMDALIAKLDSMEGDLSAQIETMLKISSLLHHTQKNITKEISRSYEKARKHHSEEAIGHMRGRLVLCMAGLTGGLHIISGVGGLAPKTTFWSCGKVNDSCGFLTRGRVTPFSELLNRFDANHNDQLAQFAETFIKVTSSSAQASQSFNSIFETRKGANQVAENTQSENLKLKKEETTQEISNDSGRAQEAIRKIDEAMEKMHQIKKTMMGG